jgi:ferric-dicitrate binding protein FerR (iron transport regulator)
MNDKQEPLARHVRPALDEARLARQLSAIEARLAPKRRVPGQLAWIALASAFGVAGAVGGAVSHRAWEQRQAALAARNAAPIASSSELELYYFDSPEPSASAVASAGDAVDAVETPSTLKLPEGSTATFGAHTHASLKEASAVSVRIELDRGEVEVEATHVEGRRFIVAAAGQEVRVVGTHFTVRIRDGGGVEVSVARGRVEVASPDGTTRAVGAGERWSVDPVVAPAASTNGSTIGSTSASTATTTARAVDANALFDAAQKARREGRVADAAKAYDDLRHKFRADPRAGVAAFELGRLRLDALGDAKGADEALRDAIVLGPTASYRADAEARRVEALDRLGSTSACVAARDAYVSRYPTGVYRKRVEGYCSKP